MSILRSITKSLNVHNFLLKLYLQIKAVYKCISISIILPVLTKSSICRRICYGLFSSSFDGRMKMFASSRYKYLSLQKRCENVTMLRRNIHRLEKGLMMENRKAVFAKEYIEETVNTFCNLLNQPQHTDLLEWSYDVLNEYFKCVASEKTIDLAREKFLAVEFKKSEESSNYAPYTFRPMADYSDMAKSFTELMEHRKSVRWFDSNRKPTRKQIDQSIALASLSPSSCNRQPFTFYVSDKKIDVDKLMSLAPGAGGFRTDVPIAILVVADMSVSPSACDNSLMYTDASLATMSLILALQSNGISSCALNWPDIQSLDSKAREIAHFDNTHRPIMLLAVGYPKPNTQVACSRRKNLDEVRQYIE